MKIFHYHPDNGELYASGVADESPREPGVWHIPAYATDKQPPEQKEGMAIVWRGDDWAYTPDLRGDLVFCTKSAMVGEITTIGPVPEGYTDKIPLTDQSEWDGSAWVHNASSERAAKHSAAVMRMRTLHEHAVDRVSVLTMAVEEGMADEADRELLVAWRRYIVMVYKVPSQPGYPMQIEWPKEPV